MTEFISFLQRRLQEKLPGPEAQFKMSPLQSISKYNTPSYDAKIAAVLILFYYKNDDLSFVIIERAASHPGDKHGGQLSLPGGRYEEIDLTLANCALRETQEEIGINAADIYIIGPLTPIYVFVSNFAVSPFIGYLNDYPSFNPQISEVSDILEISVSHIFNPTSKGKKDIQAHDFLIKETPYYEINGKTIWGATAMVLSELEELYCEYKAISDSK